MAIAKRGAKLPREIHIREIPTRRHPVMSNITDLDANDRVVGLVREILERRGIGRPILADEDLRQVGLNSLDMVNLMLSVEAEFDLKIPDADMTLQNFRSISAIDALVATLLRDKNGNQRAFPALRAEG
jgi:acyl carrier protein